MGKLADNNEKGGRIGKRSQEIKARRDKLSRALTENTNSMVKKKEIENGTRRESLKVNRISADRNKSCFGEKGGRETEKFWEEGGKALYTNLTVHMGTAKQVKIWRGPNRSSEGGEQRGKPSLPGGDL